MIKANIIMIESPTINGNSIYVLNGEILSNNDVERLGFTHIVDVDNTYTKLKNSCYGELFEKRKSGQTVCYVIAGNLVQKDECGRHMAFSSYTEINGNESIDDILSIIDNNLDKCGNYSVLKIKKKQKKVIFDEKKVIKKLLYIIIPALTLAFVVKLLYNIFH